MKKANLANLREYSSLSYCRIRNIPRIKKTGPRAEIGFLVGYVASKVWKIWFPASGKIEVVRDAYFDESRNATLMCSTGKRQPYLSLNRRF
jgi:hypothetical protein